MNPPWMDHPLSVLYVCPHCSCIGVLTKSGLEAFGKGQSSQIYRLFFRGGDSNVTLFLLIPRYANEMKKGAKLSSSFNKFFFFSVFSFFFFFFFTEPHFVFLPLLNKLGLWMCVCMCVWRRKGSCSARVPASFFSKWVTAVHHYKLVQSEVFSSDIFIKSCMIYCLISTREISVITKKFLRKRFFKWCFFAGWTWTVTSTIHCYSTHSHLSFVTFIQNNL